MPENTGGPRTDGSPPSTIGAIIALATRLTDVVRRENDLLAHERPVRLEATRVEKETLSEMFAVEMEALKSRSDTVRHAEAGELAGLKAAVAGFQEVLADHHRALKAAKTITERLVTAIGNEVARRDRPFGRYNANAEADSRRSTLARPVTIALDQMV